MSEKSHFIFFVCDRTWPYTRNEEISKSYINRIAIDENDQFEVFRVHKIQINFNDKSYHITGKSKTKIKQTLNLYHSRFILSSVLTKVATHPEP